MAVIHLNDYRRQGQQAEIIVLHRQLPGMGQPSTGGGETGGTGGGEEPGPVLDAVLARLVAALVALAGLGIVGMGLERLAGGQGEAGGFTLLIALVVFFQAWAISRLPRGVS